MRARPESSPTGEGTLPNLVVIGAMKCATTSLHHYLSLHPEILMWERNSLDFFLEEHNWSRGIDWYRSQFVGEARVYGDSSPRYTNYPFVRGVAQRMQAVVPHAKLVYIVRDPLDRLVSHYIHAVSYGRETRPLSEALATLDGNPYVTRSLYHLQLRAFLERYPRDRILLLFQEDLLHRRRETLHRLFAFLGVDASFDATGFAERRHVSSELPGAATAGLAVRRPEIPEPLARELRALFRADTQRLVEVFERIPPEWSL